MRDKGWKRASSEAAAESHKAVAAAHAARVSAEHAAGAVFTHSRGAVCPAHGGGVLFVDGRLTGKYQQPDE